jgi:hypothetical protein
VEDAHQEISNREVKDVLVAEEVTEAVNAEVQIPVQDDLMILQIPEQIVKKDVLKATLSL